MLCFCVVIMLPIMYDGRYDCTMLLFVCVKCTMMFVVVFSLSRRDHLLIPSPTIFRLFVVVRLVTLSFVFFLLCGFLLFLSYILMFLRSSL